jgi:hypothetical protein
MQEQDASQKLAADHPDQFNGDREKLTLDMAVFSLLSYLGSAEQRDWQMKRTQFVGQTMGTATLAMAVSKPDECTIFTNEQLHAMLVQSSNSFAESAVTPLGRLTLCLPPWSTLQVTSSGLTLINPFCAISFAVESSGAAAFYRPDSRGLDQPLLPNGEPVFETRLIGIRVTVHYSRIRAQHRDMPTYQEWTKRVIDGAQIWFMDSARPGEPQFSHS